MAAKAWSKMDADEKAEWLKAELKQVSSLTPNSSK